MRNLSDGVFSIVMTLLILSIQVPSLNTIKTNEELLRALVALKPVFLAYTVSFAVVGMFWLFHVQIVRMIAITHRRVLTTNMLVLFWTTTVPFTSILSTSSHVPLGWTIYMANLGLLALSVLLFWNRSVTYGCLHENVPVGQAAYIRSRILLATISFIASAALSFRDEDISRYALLAIPLGMIVLRHWVKSPTELPQE